MSLCLGRSAKSKTPPINVRDFIDIEKAKATFPVKEQETLDLAASIGSFPMFLNDELGDCTCAAAAHMEQVFAALVGAPFAVGDADVLRMYEHSGYRPGDASTDQGWTLEAAAEYLRTVGLRGKPSILATASVSLPDTDAQQVALELFGGLYEGMECPESALQQTREAKPWTVVPGSPIAGGHCITRPKNKLRVSGGHVTWGALQEATEDFERTYIDELMVFVPVDWESKLPGYLQTAGIADFAKLEALVARFAG